MKSSVSITTILKRNNAFMRRKEREVTGKSALMDIIERSRVCRVGFAVENAPYVVPLFFGYQWDEKLFLFFHCAKEGKKMECLAKNDRVCFEMEADCEIKKGAKACGWSSRYSSAMGTGRMRKAATQEERTGGLSLIMRHYGGPEKNEFDPKSMVKTEVLVLSVEEISGKKAG